MAFVPSPSHSGEIVSIESILFFILSVVGIVSALLMITRRNPVNSALFLVLNFISLAGVYLTLHAQFVAIIQIVVYAGAIMVLVIFVIMLLNLQDEKRLSESRSWKQDVGIVFAAVLLAQILFMISSMTNGGASQLAPNSVALGTVQSIGSVLFTTYLFPFELASILLLAAMIGAVVLAKKRFP